MSTEGENEHAGKVYQINICENTFLLMRGVCVCVYTSTHEGVCDETAGLRHSRGQSV